MKTKGKIIVGAAALGTGVLIYKVVSKQKGKSTIDPIEIEDISTKGDSFPLSQGSRGENVKMLQNVLLSKGGTIAKYIRDTGGADGIWGPGTNKAVSLARWPLSIDEATFKSLTGKVTSSLPSTTFTTANKMTPAGFPLKKGTRGQFVKDLQNALLKRGGTAGAFIRSSGGADGIFGPGTEKALKAAGIPKTIVTYDEFKRIVGTSSGLKRIASKIPARQRGIIPNGAFGRMI